MTTKLLVMRNPPHTWPWLFCTETIYRIELSGAFPPCMMPCTEESKRKKGKLNECLIKWLKNNNKDLWFLPSCPKQVRTRRRRTFCRLNMMQAKWLAFVCTVGVSCWAFYRAVSFWQVWLSSVIFCLLTTSFATCIFAYLKRVLSLHGLAYHKYSASSVSNTLLCTQK